MVDARITTENLGVLVEAGPDARITMATASAIVQAASEARLSMVWVAVLCEVEHDQVVQPIVFVT